MQKTHSNAKLFLIIPLLLFHEMAQTTMARIS